MTDVLAQFEILSGRLIQLPDDAPLRRAIVAAGWFDGELFAPPANLAPMLRGHFVIGGSVDAAMDLMLETAKNALRE